MIQKLGIYARQSREKETNNSIEDQILQGTQKAHELKIAYQVYVDKDESAAYDTLDNRPGFRQLLEDIEKGFVSAVFVIDQSRLTRNEYTNLVIKDVLKQHNIIIYTTLDGVIDYQDSTSEMLNDIKNIFARKLVTDTSLKIKSVLRKRVAEGKAHGAAIKPYGYMADHLKNLIVDEEEAEVVRQIYQMCINGFGSGKISAMLNKKGIKTKTYKYYQKQLINTPEGFDKKKLDVEWAPNVVLNILKNSLYKGQRIHKGELFEAPIIIEASIWDLAQEKIKKNTNAPGLSNHNYLLKSICFCGRCGSNFCGRTRPNKKDHVYYCASRVKKIHSCGIRSINIDTLESVIWCMISSSDILITRAREEVTQLKNPEYIQQLAKEKEILETNIKSQSSNKMKVLNLLTKGLLTQEEAEHQMMIFVEAIKADSELLKDVSLKLENDYLLMKQVDELQAFLNSWSDLIFSANFELQYSLVRMLVDKIVIDFDDDDEVYTIKVYAKLPESYELYTYSVGLDGMLIENAGKQRDSVRSKRNNHSLTGALAPFPHKQHNDIANRMMRRSERAYRH
ncbi:MAG TPA: recombinase family protein [Pedobacter sp.]|jgi:DNA invertase Pin-like site-specific DNA recombinase